MHMPKILVCGSRTFDAYSFVDTELDKFIKEQYHGKRCIIIHGDAKGVDAMADNYAEINNLPCLRFPALWKKYGNAAGPIRNQEMLDQGKPDMVVGFLIPGSTGGTSHMLKIAVEQGFQAKCIFLPVES